MTFNIRNVVPADLDAVTELEELCFSPETAATRQALDYRIRTFPERFFVAEQDGRIIGLINGCASDLSAIADELYGPQGHDPKGKNQMVFGLAVREDCRCRGVGTALMERLIRSCRETGMERVVLTCREEKISYYERFGYVNNGVSQSVHGGVVWYDMVLTL